MNRMSSPVHQQLSYLVPVAQNSAAQLLRDTPTNEQPQARLERCGPEALSSAELLQLVLDSKSDPLLPLRLLNQWSTLNQLTHASPAEILRVDGMTRVRLAHLRAALEMGRRMWTEPLQNRPVVRSPADAAELFLPEMAGLQHEQMRAMLLDTKNRVLGIPMIYQGSVHTTVIRISELFREAIRQNCTAIIVAHNHPSSDPTPSPEDFAVTKELVQAGKLLDVELIDHLVIGSGQQKFVSLKERGLGV